MHLTRRTALLVAGAAMAGCAAPQQPAGAEPQRGKRGGESWDSHPPLPFAVQEIYPVLHNGRIHIAGGLLGENGRVAGVSDRHIAYDPATGVSGFLKKLNFPTHHPQVVSCRGQLFLLGGFRTNPGAVNWKMTTSTEIYLHDTEDGWNGLRDAPVPHAEAVATAIDERIHIVGGRTPKGSANLAYGDHADTDHHLVYDAPSNSWSYAAPALTKRNSAAGAMIGGLWHVAGGRHAEDGPSDAHEVYDSKEDKWRTAAPMPKGAGAGGNAAGVVLGQFYVFGGEYFHDGGKVHAEVWRYDPKADAWAAAPPMPTPRHGLGGVTIGDSIWLVGGAKKPSGSETSDVVERFSAGR
jgi:N-acetylneuraminic acid mutarotase